MREMNEEKQVAEAKEADSGRKPYASPKLEVFGRVQDLTMTGSGSVSDFLGSRRPRGGG